MHIKKEYTMGILVLNAYKRWSGKILQMKGNKYSKQKYVSSVELSRQQICNNRLKWQKVKGSTLCVILNGLFLFNKESIFIVLLKESRGKSSSYKLSSFVFSRRNKANAKDNNFNVRKDNNEYEVNNYTVLTENGIKKLS